MSSYYARTDNSTANNPAINLTGAPALEITFIAETPTGGPGDLLLEGASDPNTQVQIGGQIYSLSVNWIGNLPTANNQGGNRVPAQFRGDEAMRIAVQDYPSAGAVTYLVFMPYEQATAAEMNAFFNGRIDVQNINTNAGPVPVCYVDGTRLETPKGPVAVEDLHIGSLLMTRDDGPQPIRWIGWTEHRWPGTDEKLRPVRIPAKSLNGRLPIRDLLVSPQHRILISREGFPFLDTDAEQFAPALGLEGHCGIARETARSTLRYYHVLLERHAIIRAEGLCSESFYPGPMAMRGLSFGNRLQVISLFPGLAADPRSGYGPLCRPALTRRQAVELLEATVADAVS